jgi:hypothetical protein
MLAGLLVLGGCTFAFGVALREALSRNATDGAGRGLPSSRVPARWWSRRVLLPRDHMLLSVPGQPGASWYNNAQDAIGSLICASLVLA